MATLALRSSLKYGVFHANPRLMPKLSCALTRRIHKSNLNSAKAALVLSGCGVYDGSEIHEASACLVHLSRAGVDTQIFAPNVNQMHVVDHTTGKPMEPGRNVLVESARVARGHALDLSALDVKDYSMIVFPGGFGVAKNLSDWAVTGPASALHPQVERVMKEFHSQKKPIALCCIAPVLAAKLFPGCEVTLGAANDLGGKWPYAETVKAITSLGARHVEKPVTECHVDARNKIVTAPAFMYHGAECGWFSIHLIFDGIGKMIQATVQLCK